MHGAGRVKYNLTQIKMIILNKNWRTPETATRGVYEKGVLRNFIKLTGKHLCQSLFFNKVALKKESLTQVFFCEFVTFLRTPFLQNTSGGCFYNTTETRFDVVKYCHLHEI